MTLPRIPSKPVEGRKLLGGFDSRLPPLPAGLRGDSTGTSADGSTLYPSFVPTASDVTMENLVDPAAGEPTAFARELDATMRMGYMRMGNYLVSRVSAGDREVARDCW
jgi:hypothetical protein